MFLLIAFPEHFQMLPELIFRIRKTLALSSYQIWIFITYGGKVDFELLGFVPGSPDSHRER
jgi:hypothetical protein